MRMSNAKHINSFGGSQSLKPPYALKSIRYVKQAYLTLRSDVEGLGVFLICSPLHFQPGGFLILDPSHENYSRRPSSFIMRPAFTARPGTRRRRTGESSGRIDGTMHTPHQLFDRFLNCLAHSVSQRFNKARGQTHAFIINMAQNHTVWTKDQVVPGPHKDNSNAGRADMISRYKTH